MFKEQIDLLQKLIADWDNIAANNPTYSWVLDMGLCTNCQFGMNTLVFAKGFTYEEAKVFIRQMWEKYPNYTGDPSYPILERDDYRLMKNFTVHPERLELAKYVLEYLKAYDAKS